MNPIIEFGDRRFNNGEQVGIKKGFLIGKKIGLKEGIEEGKKEEIEERKKEGIEEGKKEVIEASIKKLANYLFEQSKKEEKSITKEEALKQASEILKE